MLADRLVTALIVVIGVPAGTVAYVWLIERILALMPYKSQSRLRPWLWLGPALALLTFYLIYPSINTLRISFYGPQSEEYIGLENYIFTFTDEAMLSALKNNALWLIFFPLFTVTLGLIIAVLFDRVSYESAAKALVFLPMAISFVAAGVIWKLMYDFRPPMEAQTGTLNAVMVAAGQEPVPWLVNRTTNNPALIWVGVWMWTGFCMVILSAGLKGIPTEILEAARVDGANEWQVLMRIIIPMLGSTIAVVATTMVIWALKIFDIVYVMTNGNFGTEVIANRMYKEMFNFRHFGRASAVAIVLLAATLPVMYINIRRFRRQEEIR